MKATTWPDRGLLAVPLLLMLVFALASVASRSDASVLIKDNRVEEIQGTDPLTGVSQTYLPGPDKASTFHVDSTSPDKGRNSGFRVQRNQNFLYDGWTEVDTGVSVVRTATDITYTKVGVDDPPTQVYQDFGAGYWKGDFQIDFEVYVDPSSQGGGRLNIIDLANDLNNGKAHTESLQCRFDVISGGATFNLYIIEYDGGGIGGNDFAILSTGVSYYYRFSRKEGTGANGTMYLYVYSDAARSVLVDTLSATLSDKEDLRYLFALNYIDDNSYKAQTGRIANLDLPTSTYIHPTTGLLTTLNPGTVAREAKRSLDSTYVAASGVKNKLTYSANISHADWTKTSVTISDDSTKGPDGTTVAYAGAPTAVGGDHFVAQDAQWNLTPNESYTFQLDGKSGTSDWILLLAQYRTPLGAGVKTDSVYFNINTGTVGTVTGTSAYGISQVGDYYRCWIASSNTSGTTMATLRAYYADTDADTNYIGDGIVVHSYLTDLQFTQTTCPMPYIPTSGVKVYSQGDEISYTTPTAISGNTLFATGACAEFVTRWIPGFDYDDLESGVTKGFISTTKDESSFISYLYDGANGKFQISDGSTLATVTLNWKRDEAYWIYGQSAYWSGGVTYKRIGYSTSPTGTITWGTAVEDDGGPTLGDRLYLFYNSGPTQHAEFPRIYEYVHTDPEAVMMFGSP